MSLLSSLVPEPYGIILRVVAVVAILGGAFVTGYIKGESHYKTEIQTRIIQGQKKVITLTKIQKVTDEKAVTDLMGKVNILKERNYELQNKIKKLPTNVCSSTGNLSTSWVQYYNSSIKTSAPLSPSLLNGGTKAIPNVGSKQQKR